MFCVGFLAFCWYGVASVSSVPAVMSQFKVFLFTAKGHCHVVLCFWVLLFELVSLNSGSGVSFCLAPSLSLSVSALAVFLSLGLFHCLMACGFPS